MVASATDTVARAATVRHRESQNPDTVSPLCGDLPTLRKLDPWMAFRPDATPISGAGPPATPTSEAERGAALGAVGTKAMSPGRRPALPARPGDQHRGAGIGRGWSSRPVMRPSSTPLVLNRACDDRPMQVGLHALGIGAGARREVVDAVTAAAESCGFSTLWSGEHVVMVDASSSRYPYSSDGQIAVPPTADWNDPMIGLSFAAAASSTIRVATGVLLLPEHNPVLVAKQAATLDALSDGRLDLGVGIGWSRDEFDALGVPFARRAARTAEYVAAMRTLWREDVASFDGEFVRFDSVRVNPKPLRRRIPVVLGGNTDAALRRVAAWGDGWYGFNLDGVEDVAERLDFLEARCRESGRDVAELRRCVALRQPQVTDVGALADLGVDELVIVESPPTDPRLATEWATTLADRFVAALP